MENAQSQANNRQRKSGLRIRSGHMATDTSEESCGSRKEEMLCMSAMRAKDAHADATSMA